MEEESVGMIIGERFPQLLQGPVRAGMIRDAAVQDSTPAKFQDNKYIKNTESGCDHDEEVTGHHGLGVVVNKGQPALARIGSAARALAQILGDRARRQADSQLQFNSLAMRSCPHVGFSVAIWRIKARRSFGRRGLPRGRDFHRQNKRNPLRCQRINVSGLTTTKALRQSNHWLVPSLPPQSEPIISLVANAFGESTAIAPNTWVEIKGANLAPLGDVRTWQGSDFISSQLPTALDDVSVTMSGKNAYVYYISPNQINVLTPPDLPPLGAVQVIVTVKGVASAAFASQAQPISHSFFVLNGGPYVTAVHANTMLIGPASLYPGSTTPAKPGEAIVLYANGFGQISPPVVRGSASQMGSLPTLPLVKIAGGAATVQFAGLVSPGLYQFNVIVPASAPDGDNAIVATYNGVTTQPGTLLTIQH